MSNTLAIATVTEAFGALLKSGVQAEAGLGTTLITQDAPDRARTPQRNNYQLNLFLYMITPNLGLTNDDLPFRSAAGQVVAQPTLALDLHYMLTAWGPGESEVKAQHALAAGMSVVHDAGFIPRETIRAVAAASGSNVPGTDLADQIEAVRLSPEQLSDEDLYRLSSMFQMKYRISVGYMATVVLVQRRRQFRKAPPVTRAGATAATLRPPVIEEVAPQPAITGQPLTLRGRNLRADSVVVRINGVDRPTTSIEDDEIELTLPSTLEAGPNVVQVVHGRTLNVIDAARNAAASDPVPFVVAPRITTTSPVSAPHGGTLAFDVDPPVSRTQRVVALVGTVALERRPDAATVTGPVARVNFQLPALIAANTEHLLRVEVDGVESALEQETTPGPDLGLFKGPKVQVTP